jgi:ribonuclease BN (tRNA processing enzyme)
MRVWLLGTGGATNEVRHQACLLVEWGAGADTGRVLLDTGSGMEVVRQLVRMGCPPTAIDDIFVSHQHVDHVGGLEPLLLWRVVQSLREAGCPPRRHTRVYAEPRVLAVIGQILDTLASAVPRLYAGTLRWLPSPDGATFELPAGGRLRTFLVDHQPADGGAMGCVVERDAVKLVYSGDTRPTPRLVEFAQNADLLVYEAGGLDEDAAEVHRQGHSTAGDAGRAARTAGVGRLVLAHLPSEHLAEPMLAEARAAFDGPVEMAVDLALVEL